jgi:hypothetical protein
VLALCQQHDVLRTRGEQRAYSPHVIAAIGTVNRLEWVGEAMYHTLHSLLQVNSTWVQATLPADCLARYGTRFDDFRLPRDAAKRQALAETIGADGMAVLNVFLPQRHLHMCAWYQPSTCCAASGSSSIGLTRAPYAGGKRPICCRPHS